MTPEETVAELLEGLDNDVRSFDKRAKGFLAALSAAGFVVVPREPTEVMLKIGNELDYGLVAPSKIYEAMLSAYYKAMLAAYEESK